jgi:uncharacterized protein (TIGR03437 family)
LGRVFLALTAALVGTPAGAYYHYIHYSSRNAPFTPVQEKFDLSVLPNKTVTIYVSDTGPTNFGPNDSFASVLSQLRQAALAWNAVDSSDLRVAFGGLIQGNTSPNSPGVQVVFNEVPPGLLAFTVATPAQSPSSGPNGSFFPIQRSVTTFRRDLTQSPGPSYLDSFFTTAVHEFGHTLGLQHTFTSSAMTVAVNRNINRSRPLDADDIAGVSLLYPKASYLGTVGSIAGRVTANGQGVALASVVALRPAAPAISTLTNPDGTYRIDGLPPDTYFVYTHPLPPDADLRLPVDPSGQSFTPSAPFETIFYPGTRDLTQFQPVNVSRGNTVTGIDFAVRTIASVPVYDGATYSFIGPTPTKPAFVSTKDVQTSIAFNSNPSTPTPQSVQVLGVDPKVTFQMYGNPVTLGLYVRPALGVTSGPRHLLINLGTDMYVLPSGVNIVQKGPPQIAALLPQGDGTVLVGGSNLGPDSRVFFDGLPAAIRTPFSGNDASGLVVVLPPTGFSGQHATVTAFNGDGQSSMLLQSQNPPVYAYAVTDAPQVNASPAAVPAGTAALVDISGVNTNFIDGQVTVGFGTNDVFVRNVWVLSPTHALVNVAVLPNAALAASEVSVISGFQTIVQPFGFAALAPNPRLPAISLPLVNATPTQPNLYPGAIVSVSGSNLALSSTSATAVLTDVNNNTYPAQIVAAASGQINFAIPLNVPDGVATLRINNGTDASLPVALQIDSQPPVIASVTVGGLQLDPSRVLSPGDVLTILVSGLDPGVITTPTRVRVTASGIDLTVTQVQPSTQAGLIQLTVVVTQSFGGQQVSLAVLQDGTASSSYAVSVR